MTVVKIQRPLAGNPLWLVYDKFKARLWLAERSELPKSLTKLFDDAPVNHPERFKQYFDGAVWDQNQRIWDLSKVTPVTRRLIW